MWSFGVQEIMSINGVVVSSYLEAFKATMELNRLGKLVPQARKNWNK